MSSQQEKKSMSRTLSLPQCHSTAPRQDASGAALAAAPMGNELLAEPSWGGCCALPSQAPQLCAAAQELTWQGTSGWVHPRDCSASHRTSAAARDTAFVPWKSLLETVTPSWAVHRLGSALGRQTSQNSNLLSAAEATQIPWLARSKMPQKVNPCFQKAKKWVQSD